MAGVSSKQFSGSGIPGLGHGCVPTCTAFGCTVFSEFFIFLWHFWHKHKRLSWSRAAHHQNAPDEWRMRHSATAWKWRATSLAFVSPSANWQLKGNQCIHDVPSAHDGVVHGLRVRGLDIADLAAKSIAWTIEEDLREGHVDVGYPRTRLLPLPRLSGRRWFAWLPVDQRDCQEDRCRWGGRFLSNVLFLFFIWFFHYSFLSLLFVFVIFVIPFFHYSVFPFFLYCFWMFFLFFVIYLYMVFLLSFFIFYFRFYFCII